METTLSKCPHCGGRATLTTRFNYKQRTYFVYVKCDICGAQGKAFTCSEDPELSNWNNVPCDDAVQAWNMRYNGN